MQEIACLGACERRHFTWLDGGDRPAPRERRLLAIASRGEVGAASGRAGSGGAGSD